MSGVGVLIHIITQLLAQISDARSDAVRGFTTLKTVVVIAHIVLAVFGLIFGKFKGGAGGGAAEGAPVAFNQRAVAQNLKTLRTAAEITLLIGGLATARTLYAYFTKHSPIAYENAWHAGTTMFLPGLVYFILTRGGPALAASPARLMTIQIMAAIHAGLAVLIELLYILAYEKGLLYWIIATALYLLFLLGMIAVATELQKQRRVARQAARAA